ncbi:MAG: type 1 glutamine amidotransferase [Deltaproteobacteria bacterium]|nr:type 1 glutamine amidotransferase [Deltaproteobacteria bacterium]
MKIHYLQHVEFENLAYFEQIFTKKGHDISVTRQYLNESLPKVESFDWLVIMGGPMGIFDEQQYPWLAPEKHFIKSAIDSQKTVLGICLGAQLLAHVLGARVVPGEHREIGWFDVIPHLRIRETRLAPVFNQPISAFHWHSDTFEIPEGAYSIGSTDACSNQGFVFEDNVVALQFHLETTPASALALIDNCGHELDGSQYVQTTEEIKANTDRFTTLNRSATALLEAMGA